MFSQLDVAWMKKKKKKISKSHQSQILYMKQSPGWFSSLDAEGNLPQILESHVMRYEIGNDLNRKL